MLMRALATFVVLSEIVGGVAVLRLHVVKARGVRNRNRLHVQSVLPIWNPGVSEQTFVI